MVEFQPLRLVDCHDFQGMSFGGRRRIQPADGGPERARCRIRGLNLFQQIQVALGVVQMRVAVVRVDSAETQPKPFHPAARGTASRLPRQYLRKTGDPSSAVLRVANPAQHVVDGPCLCRALQVAQTHADQGRTQHAEPREAIIRVRQRQGQRVQVTYYAGIGQGVRCPCPATKCRRGAATATNPPAQFRARTSTAMESSGLSRLISRIR